MKTPDLEPVSIPCVDNYKNFHQSLVTTSKVTQLLISRAITREPALVADDAKRTSGENLKKKKKEKKEEEKKSKLERISKAEIGKDKNSWLWVKHAWLYSDRLQTLGVCVC